MKQLSTPVLHSCIFWPLYPALLILGVLLWDKFGLPRQYSAFGGLPAIFMAQGVAYLTAHRFGKSLKEEHVEVVERSATDIAIRRPFLLKGVYAKITRQGIQSDHLVRWQDVRACRIVKGKNDFGYNSSRVEVVGKDDKILLKIPLIEAPEEDIEEFIGVIKAALTNSVPQS